MVRTHSSIFFGLPLCFIILIRSFIDLGFITLILWWLTKQGVQAKDWVLRQVRLVAIGEPLHPLLPSLLECFADNCVSVFGTEVTLSTSSLRSDDRESLRLAAPLQSFTNDEVAEVFESANVSCQILVLYFILTFNALRSKQITAPARQYEQSLHTSVRPAYSDTLLNTIPVTRILTHVSSNPVWNLCVGFFYFFQKHTYVRF